MLNSLIESALNNRFLVLAGTLLVAALGGYSAMHLPIDAVPDLTNVQVQVITEAPARVRWRSRPCFRSPWRER